MDHRTIIGKDSRGHTTTECRAITLVQRVRIYKAGSRRGQSTRELWLDGRWEPDPSTPLQGYGSRDEAVFAAGCRIIKQEENGPKQDEMPSGAVDE